MSKHAALLLIAILTASSLAATETATASINPTFTGRITSIDNPPKIKFSIKNDTTLYSDSDQLNIKFTVSQGEGFSNFLCLGGSLTQVSCKASWQNSPVTIFSWSYHNPADLKDDEPNATGSVSYTLNLADAPIGNHQIKLTVKGFAYPTTIGTYWIFTASGSSTLNFTIANPLPVTPTPTFSLESGILWKTDIPWNLTGTPAQDLWDTDIFRKGRSWTEPVIANGVIYAGANSVVTLNRYWLPGLGCIDVYAFDAQTGRQIWHYQTDFGSITNLAVADGRVYFGLEADSMSSLNALNASNGSLLWSTPCKFFYSTPVAENDRIYINSFYSILAFNGADGSSAWNYTTDARITDRAPTIAKGVLYEPSDEGLYALNTENGSKLWSHETNGGFSSATVANDVVYAASGDGNIYAFNAATGDELWRHDTTAPEFIAWVNSTGHTTPVYYEGVLYFTCLSFRHIHITGVNGAQDICQTWTSSSVYALNTASGRKVWNYTDNTGALGSPVTVANGIVYTEVGNRILGFNSQNGSLIWNYTNAQLSPNSKPIIDDDVIYAGFSDGQLYALRAPESPITTLLIDNLGIAIIIAITVVSAIALTALVRIFRRKHQSSLSSPS